MSRRSASAGRVASKSRLAWYGGTDIDLSLEVTRDQIDPERKYAPTETEQFGALRVKLWAQNAYDSLGLDLSALNVEELIEMRRFLNHAIDTAVTVAKELDAHAQHCADRDEEIVPLRYFRGRPTLVIRPTPLPKPIIGNPTPSYKEIANETRPEGDSG